jgi:hypothetical protein
MHFHHNPLFKQAWTTKLAIWWLLLFSIMVGSVSAAAGQAHLVVRNFASGRIITSLEVKSGDRFTLRYIHSLDKKPIFEQFLLSPKHGLVLEKTWFRMFGAGLGHWPGHGHLTQKNGWITIDEMNYVLGNFVLRIGSPGVDHTILYQQQEINLSALAPGCRAIVEFKP